MDPLTSLDSDVGSEPSDSRPSSSSSSPSEESLLLLLDEEDPVDGEDDDEERGGGLQPSATRNKCNQFTLT